ncbi:UNVERIFIED_CONTAM: hypothetical protein NCL1_60800 [Trichonephila clavipes]
MFLIESIIMSKRKSPFAELPILSKMHIGVKEINMYSVNTHENMKKVYGKKCQLILYFSYCFFL